MLSWVRRFAGSEHGGVIAYVTIAPSVFIGLGVLAVDVFGCRCLAVVRRGLDRSPTAIMLANAAIADLAAKIAAVRSVLAATLAAWERASESRVAGRATVIVDASTPANRFPNSSANTATSTRTREIVGESTWTPMASR
jgi:hypothetical protein